MKSFIRVWKSLIPEHKDYFFIYLTAVLWAIAFAIFTPPSAQLIVLDRIFIVLWLGSAILGAVLALSGLLRKDNLLLERLGVTILSATPLIYSSLQLSIMISMAYMHAMPAAEWTSRIGLVVMGIWLFLFLNKRRRQLKFRVEELKSAPIINTKKADI
jgi:hypothetical protein